MIRRAPPLAIAIVLVAGALVAAAWSMRRTASAGYSAVRDGEALTLGQTVRGDLADLGGPPTAADLEAVLSDHRGAGLRYVAMLDSRGHVAVSAGTPSIESFGRMERGGMRIDHTDGRVRIEVRAQFRRAWGPGRGAWWLAMEIEPAHAAEMRGAASRTLLVGIIAALLLLGIAGWLVRRELQRRAQERERERERRLASLGEMSAVLAHEIKNPLASLKGNAQLLASMLPAGEKSKAKADRVVDEAVRLEKLTQDLLKFVRTGELKREKVSPASIVREVVHDMPADAITIDDAAAPETWSIDPARIREVLVNLVDNALAAGAPVKIRVARERRVLAIEVADSGPGVNPEDREKIFEPFFTAKTRGTGLGLAIAKRVVELHGGTIRVDEGQGGGALFRIEIPEA
ncbi:MAG: HAMP domain-containing histidine kinase [Kofleriaceae bacterium]|nr:HAMP domain-containing histidine kinase [Kofleriaceae bacterium]